MEKISKSYKGKLKTVKELSELTPSVPSKVILMAHSGVDAEGFVKLKPTSQLGVWVLAQGYTLPLEAFDYVEDSAEPEEFVSEAPEESVSACAEEILSTDLSLTIPETQNEPSEAPEPLIMTNSLFSKNSDFKHRTHYVKLVLKDPNLSFRYFFQSEDNQHQENAWWLKDHKNKQSISVNKAFIRKHYEDIVDMFEVIGRYYPKKGYLKIVKNLRTNELIEIKE